MRYAILVYQSGVASTLISIQKYVLVGIYTTEISQHIKRAEMPAQNFKKLLIVPTILVLEI